MLQSGDALAAVTGSNTLNRAFVNEPSNGSPSSVRPAEMQRSPTQPSTRTPRSQCSARGPGRQEVRFEGGMTFRTRLPGGPTIRGICPAVRSIGTKRRPAGPQRRGNGVALCAAIADGSTPPE